MTAIPGSTAPAATAAVPGTIPDDPLRIAESLREEFRAGAAERDRERRFPYEQCDAFRASGLAHLLDRLHDALGDNANALMQFAGGGSPFLVMGSPTGQNPIWGGLGVTLAYLDTARMFLDYNVLTSARQTPIFPP